MEETTKEQPEEGEPDVLIAIGYSSDIKQAVSLSVKQGFAKNFLFVDRDVVKPMLGESWARALNGTFGISPSPVRSRQKAILEEEYSEEYLDGNMSRIAEESDYIAHTYDAIAIAALAAEKSGSNTDSKKIKEAITMVSNPPGIPVNPGADGIRKAMKLIRDGLEINYQGGAGSQDFDEQGDVSSGLEVWMVVDGAIRCDSYITSSGNKLADCETTIRE